MKKTLTALAVLGTFAGGALAANVQVYGLIDESFVHSTIKNNDGTTHKNELFSGLIAGPRIGLKGVEDLGNGWKVGFVLENGFDIDNGALGQGGLLFGREAVLTVEGDVGKFYFGRISTIACDGGSIGILQNASPFGNSFGEVASMYLSTGSQFARYDNTIAYVAPEVGGLQVSAMYSMGANDEENKASTERYAVVGAKYAAGPLTAVGTVEYTINDHEPGVKVDDGVSVIVGGNYKLGNGAALYGKVNYFDNVATLGDVYSNGEANIVSTFEKQSQYSGSYSGYGAELAVTVPAFGGNVMVGGGYRAAETETNVDIDRYNVAVGYMYSVSKRTTLYGIAGYAQEEVQDLETKVYQAGVGMIHTF